MKRCYFEFIDFLDNHKKISVLIKAVISLGLLIIAIVLYFKLANKSLTFVDVVVNLTIVLFVLVSYQLIHNAFLKNMELNILSGQIGLALKTHLKSDVLKEKNDEHDLISFINSAHEIKFPETSTVEDIEMLFINFNESFLNEETQNNIIDRLNKFNIKLKILIMNPFSIYIKLRGKDLKRGDGYITENQGNYIKLLEFKDKLINEGIPEEKIEIKFYDTWPGALYVRCGQFAWFAPLWAHASARKNCFVRIDMSYKSKISENLKDSFDKLWNNERSKKTIIMADGAVFDDVMSDASLYLHTYKELYTTLNTHNI